VERRCADGYVVCVLIFLPGGVRLDGGGGEGCGSSREKTY